MAQLKEAALACISRAELLIKQAKYSEAVTEASDSLNMCPMDIAFLLRGEAYYRQGECDNAIDDLKKAYKYLFMKISQGAPDSKGLFFKTNVMMAYLSLLKGDYAEGQVFFLQAQEEQKEHPSLFQGEMNDLSQKFKPEMQMQEAPMNQFQEEDKEQGYNEPKFQIVQQEQSDENENGLGEDDSPGIIAVPSTQMRKQVIDQDQIQIQGVGIITQPDFKEKRELTTTFE